MAHAAKDVLVQKSPISLPEALRVLIRSEKTERYVRSTQNRTREAKFPHHKDFTHFDYTATPVTQETIQSLETGEFTHKPSNLIFVGGAGTGKHTSQSHWGPV